jgi:hypothetical protein
MPEETGFRFSGVGPASLNSLQLADLVEWSLDTDCKLDEVAHLAAKTKKSIPVNYGWEGSLKMELALTPRELGGSLAIGAWSGVNVSEWSFEAELETEEATGPYDLWRIHKAGKMSWTMDAEKWQATDD